MKRWIPWMAAALIIVLLVSGLWRAVAHRQAQNQALAQAAAAQRAETPLQLQAHEVMTLRPQSLALGLPLSGALRAVQTATVKARVPGELQGLAVREGDTVRAGQVIARVDATETAARLRQARQQADAARAQVDIAQRQFSNNQALVDKGFISSTALQTSQANWQAAQANHQAALAAVAVAQKAQDDTVLRSPIDGQVAQRLAQNGERVNVEARIVEIVDLTRLELEAPVPAADSVLVRVGQQAHVRPEGSSQTVQAQVVRINPSAQAGSRAVLVYLAIDRTSNPEAAALLRQGLFMQGTLATGNAQVLAVPLDAVRADKPEPYVQTVENGRIAHRSVRLGARSQQGAAALVALDSGVSEGAQIVVGAVGVLREGTPVRVADPAAVKP